MICPYCTETMKKGYIPSQKVDLCWIPEGEKPNVFTIHTPNSVTLATWDLFSCTAEAFYCESCRKVILEVPEQVQSQLKSSPYQF